MADSIAKVRAPTNIALVKYWGKNPYFEKYHIPTKSSLSFSVEGLYTETLVERKGNGSGKIDFVLNGKRIENSAPEFSYVSEFFEKAFAIWPFMQDSNYSIESENNFPTAAGFASSASGFAALALAVSKAQEGFLDRYSKDEKALSVFARLGSGSATRSIPFKGGLVQWKRGLDPRDVPAEKRAPTETEIFSSFAESILPPEHFSDLRLFYVKADTGEKKIKSRAGMKQTISTYPLYWEWVKHEENVLLPATIESAKKMDWSELFRLTIALSNGLHSAMLSTAPSISYLNDTSREIVSGVNDLNSERIVSAYTFDAGPNPVVFSTRESEEQVKELLERIVGEENIFRTRVGKGPEFLKA